MGIWDMNGDRASYDEDQATRQRWFEKVANRENWKLPIDCWIAARDLDDCSNAAVWFAGAPLTVVERAGGRVRVVAHGYYATIGA